MKLPIRVKMFGLVALVLVLAVAAVLFKTSGTFRTDKELFVREFSDRFTGTVARLTSDRMSSIRNQAATFVSNRESLQSVQNKDEINRVIFERFSDALAVTVFKRQGSSWEPAWIERNSSGSAKTWPEGFEKTLFKGLNHDEISREGLVLSRVSLPNGTVATAFGFSANLQSGTEGGASEKTNIVAIISNATFEDIIKDFKGDINEVFIIDRKGFVYAHPDSKMATQVLDKHPLVAEIVAEGKEGATQLSTDMSGASIIGSYRKVKNTNLFIVSTTPTAAAFQAADSLIKGVVLFGVGFGLIGVVIAMIVAGRITNPIHRLQEIASKIGSGDFQVPVNVSSNDEVGELAKSIDAMKVGLLEREEKLEHSKQALVQSEKMSAFGQLSAGIAHEVKNPLAGILGHAQLAKSKIKDADILKHIEVIEKETRRTKEIVENLMKFARAEKAELKPSDLYEIVHGGTELVDHQLSLMGVKIVRKLNHVAAVNANGNQLQQVLLNLMMNAGHAMEKSSTKEITVFLDQVGDIARIRIQDTGHGMPPEVKKRLFEPFFTTKPAGKGTGLGLSVSFGIIRDHQGKIYVESEVGKGTTFFIDLPIAKDAGPIVSTPKETKPASNPLPSVPPTPAASIPSAPIPSAPPAPSQEMAATKIVPPPAPATSPNPAPAEAAYKSPPPSLASEGGATAFSTIIRKPNVSSKLAEKLVTGEIPTSMPSSPFGAMSTPDAIKTPTESTVTQTKSIPGAIPGATGLKLGGKAPQNIDLGEAPEASSPALSGTAIVPPPAPPKEEPAYVAPAPKQEPPKPPAVEPPGAPTNVEAAYAQPKPEGDFKVSIRKPKLKL